MTYLLLSSHKRPLLQPYRASKTSMIGTLMRWLTMRNQKRNLWTFPAAETSSLTIHSRPRPSRISRRVHGHRRSPPASSSTKRTPLHQAARITLQAFSQRTELVVASIVTLTLSGEHHPSERTSIMIISHLSAILCLKINLNLTS